jgi:polyisoprenoid-binding protein YceI
VTFRTGHFATKVRGEFTDFRGTITADPQAWKGAVIVVEIRTASVDPLNGIAQAPDGERVGFEAETRVDRTAFGVNWNRAVEGGGAMLDDVEVEIIVEAVRSER